MIRIGGRVPPGTIALILLALAPVASLAGAQQPIRTVQTLRVEDLGSLPIQDGKPVTKFTVENEVFEVTVDLENRVHTQEKELVARLECDHPVDLIRRFGRDHASVVSQEFILYDFRNAGRASLRLPRENLVCDLFLRTRDEKQYRAGVRIQSESIFSRLETAEICSLGPITAAPSPAELFENASYPMLGCVQPVASVELLSDPIDSFNAKVRALTGSTLPLDVIKRQDFEYPIDFSRAPRFDAVLLATMEFKIDFYGTTLTRILKWHAERGAQVRIVVPGVPATFFPKDAAFLRALETANRNIQVQFYKDTSKSSSRMNRLHRVSHAKMLVGLSLAEPERSFSVLGGRNVKDTFLFHSPPDYRKHKGMEKYGSLTSPFSFFADLEVLAAGQQSAASLVRDFISFWNRDKDSLHMRPSANVEPSARVESTANLGSGSRVRHVLSIPFADGYQMEKVVVDLIRSARKNIRMVSPYFRPTAAIGAEIKAAVARGVTITFVTELDLMKDNAPPITMGVNTQSVNRYRKLINIYISKDKHSIIHSKAILVDDELLFVSGTNLNMRSFIHDVENGLLIDDRAAAAQFREIFDEQYLPQAIAVTGDLKVQFIDQLVIPLVNQYF